LISSGKAPQQRDFHSSAKYFPEEKITLAAIGFHSLRMVIAVPGASR